MRNLMWQNRSKELWFVGAVVFVVGLAGVLYGLVLADRYLDSVTRREAEEASLLHEGRTYLMEVPDELEGAIASYEAFGFYRHLEMAGYEFVRGDKSCSELGYDIGQSSMISFGALSKMTILGQASIPPHRVLVSLYVGKSTSKCVFEALMLREDVLRWARLSIKMQAALHGPKLAEYRAEVAASKAKFAKEVESVR